MAHTMDSWKRYVEAIYRKREAEITPSAVTWIGWRAVFTVSDRDNERQIGALGVRVQWPHWIHDNTLTVYGWNADADVEEIEAPDDREVEVATIWLTETDHERLANDTDAEIAISLTKRQIEDALALYNAIYVETEAVEYPEDYMNPGAEDA